MRAVPHPSYAIYTVTVGITGRATQEGRWPCHGSSPCNWGNGGIAKETYGATFHVDETFKNIILPKSGFSIPEVGADATRHVVNGSYTESGQYDESGDGHLVAFSCSGRLSDSAAESTSYNISGRPHGGSWAFSAPVLQYGLKGTTTSGGPSGSPCDGQGSFVDGPSSSFGAPTWTASFKLVTGKQTITKLVTVHREVPASVGLQGRGWRRRHVHVLALVARFGQVQAHPLISVVAR